VVFIAISDENKDVVTSFLKRRTISSWVGLEGITQSTRDRYGIHGIPTTITVNQEGIAVARTHPVNRRQSLASVNSFKRSERLRIKAEGAANRQCEIEVQHRPKSI